MNLSGMLNDAPERVPRPSRSPQQRPLPSLTRSSSSRQEHVQSGTEMNALSRESSHVSRQSQGPDLAPRYASPYQGHQPSPGSALPYNSAVRHSPTSTRSSSLPGPISTNHAYLQQPLTPSANSARSIPYPHGTPGQYASPTPPSQRSHTPGSVRHSPQAPIYAPPPGQHNAYMPRASHPGMPLGPPQRPSTQGSQVDAHPQQYVGGHAAPIHSSGAYNGNIDLLTRSPGLQREQQNIRSRGESLSVSPKTRLAAPIVWNQSSNQGGNERAYAMQMQSPPHQRGSLTNITNASASQSPHDVKPPPTQALKRSSTMDLSNMLTPVEEKPSRDYFTHAQQAVQVQNHQHSVTPEMSKMSSPAEKTLLKQDVGKANGIAVPAFDGTSDVKKRSAESELESAPPAKRGKKRKYTEPPLWAQRSKRNPHLHGSGQNDGQQRPRPTDQVAGPNHRPQSANTTTLQPDLERPWLNTIPIDGDLLQARNVFGSWEKSIRWNTPYPDLLRAVQDWLVTQLRAHEDVLQNPALGSLEIEAKIGRLLRHQDGERATLPVLNMTLLNPMVNRDYRFESELEEHDFKVLNKFLNDTLVGSRQEGRVPMDYKRVEEIDSFSHLSKLATNMLPTSIKSHSHAGRELKLRSTHAKKSKSPEPVAQIVKVSLADLHIFNPSGYDCRISMNAEVNFKRPDINIEAIIVPASENNPVPPSRRKDRLSYKHLAYQIDLTTVNVSNMAPKYEMEIEVEARAIWDQIRLMSEGKPHAFGEVVSGFLDNATFLMRQR